ncbi:MAG: ECF transporter S component [Clostridia bacterium]|nr:ECF transporter S component [Clostridia bacterium]
MEPNRTKKITFGGLMIALVYVTTFSIKIPVPFTQGYIHAGDSMIFIAAILLGWKYGALAGGIGSALADILGGYANWALPTLIIKSIMGAAVGWIAYDAGQRNNKAKIMLGITVAFLWFGFTAVLRNIIKSIALNGAPFLGEIDGVTTMEELLILSQKVQNQLLTAAILIPLAIVILSVILGRIDKKLFSVDQLLGMLIAGLWMVTGYYFAAGLMYGSFIVPIFSIPWNIVQFVIGLVIAYLVIFALRKTPVLKYFE